MTYQTFCKILLAVSGAFCLAGLMWQPASKPDPQVEHIRSKCTDWVHAKRSHLDEWEQQRVLADCIKFGGDPADAWLEGIWKRASKGEGAAGPVAADR